MKKTNKAALWTLLALSIIFILLCIISHLYKNLLLFGITVNVGTTFLTVLIIFIVYFFTGGEPQIKAINDLKVKFDKFVKLASKHAAEDIEKLGNKAAISCLSAGVTEILPTRGDSARLLWQKFLDSGYGDIDKVDLLGKVLDRVVNSLKDKNDKGELIKKIQKGLQLRILIVDPKSDFAERRKIDESGSVDSKVGKHDYDKDLHDAIIDIIKKLKGNKSNGFFFFGYYAATTYCQITRVGQEMLITNYIYRQSGRHCPSFKVEEHINSNIYEKYKKMFEELKNNAVRNKSWSSKTL